MCRIVRPCSVLHARLLLALSFSPRLREPTHTFSSYLRSFSFLSCFHARPLRSVSGCMLVLAKYVECQVPALLTHLPAFHFTQLSFNSPVKIGRIYVDVTFISVVHVLVVSALQIFIIYLWCRACLVVLFFNSVTSLNACAGTHRRRCLNKWQYWQPGGFWACDYNDDGTLLCCWLVSTVPYL